MSTEWLLLNGQRTLRLDTQLTEDESLALTQALDGFAAQCRSLESQNQALQERVMEAQAAADEANTFLSQNRGISGFIADDDPTRPTDQWEPYVDDLRDKLAALQERIELLEGFVQGCAESPHFVLCDGDPCDCLKGVARQLLSPTQETDPE